MAPVALMREYVLGHAIWTVPVAYHLVSLLDLLVTLNGRSHDFADPRFLNFHLRREMPGSAELLKEVQQVVVLASIRG